MRLDKELMKGSTVVLLLTLLNKRPMYGYEIIKEMEATSGGVFSMKEGTIYPILHALESEKMLDSYWDQGQGDRKRKFYKITAAGERHLNQKRGEWIAFRTAVDQVLGGTV